MTNCRWCASLLLCASLRMRLVTFSSRGVAHFFISSLKVSAKNAIKIILLGDSAVGKTKCGPGGAMRWPFQRGSLCTSPLICRHHQD